MASKEASILAVDNEPDMLLLLTGFLARGGYKVIPASGAEDALRKAKAQHPNLVVTDSELPKVSGVELIEALKKDEETKDIPVIAATAHMWADTAHGADSHGYDGFVGKPYDVVLLLSEVKTLLEPHDC